jgi:UDP:flavonoid glycosyltransferase YjiC (YdhE family)
MRRRVLFAAENITLAQVVRLLVLAKGLNESEYEVHFACSDFDPLVFAGTTFQRWPLYTIDRELGFKILAKGERLYDVPTLERYVADELHLIERIQPEIIVGDFRLSLAVSAKKAGVPCASLINAYWSPYLVRENWPVPDHPIVRLVGVSRAERYFPQALPKVFAHFAAPLNALRKRHGLPEFESLPHSLCFGDLVLHPDIPELCKLEGAPPTHHYLGIVPWSPDVPVPDQLRELGPSRPLVYVTLGSSGDLAALPTVLQGLAGLPIQGVLSTAGRFVPEQVPDNFVVAEMLPGALFMERALFVVTNGGASTSYQALAAGVPVLGIPSNMDQYLAMAQIVEAGAGVQLRSGGLSKNDVQRAAVRLLDAKAMKSAAESLAQRFAAVSCQDRFRAALASALAGSTEAAERAIIQA